MNAYIYKIWRNSVNLFSRHWAEMELWRTEWPNYGRNDGQPKSNIAPLFQSGAMKRKMPPKLWNWKWNCLIVRVRKFIRLKRVELQNEPSNFLETMFSQNICFQWYHIHRIHTKSPYHRTPVQHCYPVRYLDRYSLCKSLGTKWP